MSYIEISTTGNISGAKKFQFTYSSPMPVGWDVPSRTGETLDGGRFLSYGVGKKKWVYEVLFRFSGTAAYGVMTDLRALFENTAVASNALKFRDNPDSGDTTVYDVILLNKGSLNPKPLSPKWYTPDGVWTQTLELQQI